MRFRIFTRNGHYYIQTERRSKIALHTKDYDTALKKVKELGIKKPPCPYCGSEEVPSNRKYCSNTCKEKFNQDVLRFGAPRKVILDAFDNKCALCNCPDNLVIHHLDNYGLKVKIKERNNNCDNLILLCDQCHGQVHHSNIISRLGLNERTKAVIELNDVLEKAVRRMKSVKEINIGCNPII